jgi:pimeloyl-ACP methyl ester carboxylesterase
VTEIRNSWVAANGVELHVAEAGPEDGPLVVLLHGFPEHWRAWRAYFAPLAEAGYHVVAPDQRGYGASDKPAGAGAYDLDVLAADVCGLADHFGRRRFSLVGHDWGASVGWWLATTHPERLERLVAISAPHPAVWREAMRDHPGQRRQSAYVRFFALPWLPEVVLRFGRYAALAGGFAGAARPAAFPPDEMDHYRTAWARPGALTGMLNWYRALLRKPLPASAGLRVAPPLLLIWGEKDPFAVRALADRSLALCDDGRALFLDQATHWAPHDEPERCLGAMLDFLAEPVQPSA